MKRLTSKLPAMGSLGQRALAAGSWSMGTTVSHYALRLISNLIMTRLLVPEAFGMIAMAATLLTALNLFTDIGLNRSIAREPDGDQPKFLQVAWVFQILRGLVVGGGVLLAALLLWVLGPIYAPEGSVYAQPEMPGLIAMIALSPVIAGAYSTNRELALRQLKFGRASMFQLYAQVASTVSMVVFAWFSPTVWALMCGMLMNNVVMLLLTFYALDGPRMRLTWDREIALRLWNFGKWLLGSSTMTFIARNADRLILGGLMSAISFGIYSIALIWLEAGRTLITRLAEGVGFPTIAEVMRDRPQDVPRLYRKFQTVVDALCLAGFVGIWVVGPLIISALYTEQYHQAGAYVQLMAPMFLVVRYQSFNSLVLNTGNSRAMLVIATIQALFICISIPLAYTYFGVGGAIVASVLTPMSSVPYALYLTARILGKRQTQVDIAIGIAILAISALVAMLGMHQL